MLGNFWANPVENRRHIQVTTMNVRTTLILAWGIGLAACASQVTANPLSASSARVTVDAGTLEGRLDSARQLLVFKGIPYAVPPVGELRWRAPAPPAHWGGVRQASTLGHNCVQHQPYPDIDPYQAGVSEDCLNLNIWTPSLDGRRPVMVWIHGGGFFAGFGGEDRHDGAVLAAKGAVVVTLNYRLGAFGFLAHPALAAESGAHASGNYGLMDQVAALAWVRRNIARFGGDSTRVTIFGESAGGMSVGDLVASPMAKGLFQRAIIESGTGTGSFTQRASTAEAVGMRLATALGIEGNGATTATRLRSLSVDTILAASLRVAGNPGSPIFWPNVDGKVLMHSVDSTIALGLASEVPVMVGSNADEPASAFGAPSRAFARLMSARGVPAYLYQFTRVADDSVNRKRGAYHSAEITFVFGRARPLSPGAGHTAYDASLADAMSDYWLAFAASGDPNGPPARGKLPHWPAYDRTGEGYLELGPTIVAKRDLRHALFDSLDVVARAQGELRPR